MTSLRNPERTKGNRQSFVVLVLIPILVLVIFTALTSASVANFLGATFVGIGGWVMVLIRQAQQNAARAAQSAQGSALKPPRGSWFTAAIVGLVKLPSRSARKAEREKIKADNDQAAAFKKAVEDAEDLGFGLLGLGGLMVAAGAFRSMMGW